MSKLRNNQALFLELRDIFGWHGNTDTIGAALDAVDRHLAQGGPASDLATACELLDLARRGEWMNCAERIDAFLRFHPPAPPDSREPPPRRPLDKAAEWARMSGVDSREPVPPAVVALCGRCLRRESACRCTPTADGAPLREESE